jgi:hypothetical protein
MNADFSEYIGTLNLPKSLETMIIMPIYPTALCTGDGKKSEVHSTFISENNTGYCMSIETDQSIEELQSIYPAEEGQRWMTYTEVDNRTQPSVDVAQRIAGALSGRHEAAGSALAESVRRSRRSMLAESVRRSMADRRLPENLFAEINPQTKRQVTGNSGEIYTLYQGKLEAMP